MKRNKKWWIVAAVLLLIAAVAFFALRWAWKYYGLPERPDRTEYKTIEERAEKALAFAQDFRRKAIVASTYVMHGPGRGSTAKNPRFSNRPGSECSSLGRFLVTKERGHKIKRSFRLKGMDTDNQSAFKRGLMIHSARWVDQWCWKDYIPLNRVCCQGCVTISPRGMDYLWPLINQERKPLLLWNFRSRNAVK